MASAKKTGDKMNGEEEEEAIKSLRVFTDGACRGNGKKWAVAGIGVHFPKKQTDDIAALFTSAPITNQRAELCAILTALTVISNKKLYKGYDDVVVYTDSQYSIDSLTKWIAGWKKRDWTTAAGKPVLNQDLIRPLDELVSNFPIPVRFIHVDAHTKKLDYRSRHNAIADQLANEGIDNANANAKKDSDSE